MTGPKVYDVFTPADFPVYTYVARDESELEDQCKQALHTRGQIISLVGPSKSGKTVLVRKVIGDDYLIRVSGASIRAPDELWERVLDWIGEPHSTTASDVEQQGKSGAMTGTVQAGFPGIINFKADGTKTTTTSASATLSATSNRRGLAQVVTEIANSEWVVFVDDFHYMNRELQAACAKQLKAAAEQGIKLVTASVPHRADDVVRALPELRGRVAAVDVGYWSVQDLKEIAKLGFAQLNVELDMDSIALFAQESAGSPQLMQNISLNAALELGVEAMEDAKRSAQLARGAQEKTLRRASRTTDFRSLLPVLLEGPKKRGTERVRYQFAGGTEGDVYDCLVRALAADPPRLSFPYDELTSRVRRLCVGAAPPGSSVATSCGHVVKLVETQMPNERVLDWDPSTQTLDITDPYLLFFLRWSSSSPASPRAE
jgi:hypothetical protein